MAFYVPTPSWQQVGTGVGVVTVRCIGTVRVAVSATAPDDSAGMNYGWSSTGPNSTLDARGGNVWVKAANAALSPDGFFSAIWIDGAGTFEPSTELPPREYRVQPVEPVPGWTPEDNALHLSLTIGQSLSVGPATVSGDRTAYRAESLAQRVFELSGLVRADNAVAWMHGPGALGYNYAVQITDLKDAYISNNAPVVFLSALAANRIRSSYSLGTRDFLISYPGFSGQPSEQFDDNLPVQTGTEATTIFNDFQYWVTQASTVRPEAVLNWLVVLQGTGDKEDGPGVWKAQWEENLSDFRAVLTPLGHDPRVMVVQSAGDINTSQGGETWDVVLDQLDLSLDGNNVLACPLYPYPVADNNVHPDDYQTGLFSEVIEHAKASLESGGEWSHLDCTATRSGNTVTLTFNTNTGESLVAHSASKYVSGCTNLGFETDVGITSVNVSGNTVTVVCPSAPAFIQYAKQAQDMSGVDGYTGHRGLLRTSWSAQSVRRPDTLYRWVPSFRHTF